MTDNTIVYLLQSIDDKLLILYNGIYVLFALSAGLVVFYLLKKIINVFY